MIDYIKTNWPGLSLIASGVVLLAALAFVQGCNFYEMMKMPVQTEMQRVTGAAPIIPLSEYPAVRTTYIEESQAEAERLQARTERTLEAADAAYADKVFWADFGAWFVDLGLTTVAEGGAPVLNSYVPGAGNILSGLLVGLGGYLTGRTGKKKLKQDYDDLRRDAADLIKEAVESEAAKWKEKIASFNKALEVAGKSELAKGGDA